MNTVREGAQGDPGADPATTIRELLAAARTAVLATLMPDDGSPYASLVEIAPEDSGDVILFLSRLAWHSRNLAHDARGSLLVQEAPLAGGTLARPRVSLMGRTVALEHEDAGRIYFATHPSAQAYASFNDFGFHRFIVEQAHLVAGFGRIATLSREDLEERKN